MTESKMLWLLLLYTGTLSIASAQTCTLSCGNTCCPPTSSRFDTNGALRTLCCTGNNRIGCCSLAENINGGGGGSQTRDQLLCQALEMNAIQPVDVEGSTQCGSQRFCPDSCDDNGRPRNQCCNFFKSGCCSIEENQGNEDLLYITIGLAGGVFLLTLIIIFAVLCCICCGLCDCVSCFRRNDPSLPSKYI